MQNYVVASLQLHLFFGRIMKEHAFFLEVGFTLADTEFRKEAIAYKQAFEELLRDVIDCSQGVIDKDFLAAGEMLTEYTLRSEQATCQLTGSSIDMELTKLEENLGKVNRRDYNFVNDVKIINRKYIDLLDGFIEFKTRILNNVLNCNMFTVNYPLLIDHILREAKLYEAYIKNYEKGGEAGTENLRDEELFWNQIMMEHALFIRGLLDPTENDLIMAADDFVGTYAELLNAAKNMNQRTMAGVTKETLEQTIKYRDFKAAGTKGINACEIRSLILPLLADHVLREANHYIRILES